jgi:hypothetical protein
MREQAEVEPYWAGLTAALCFYYGLWAAYSVYPKPGTSTEGPGMMGIYIMMFFAFFVGLIAAVVPLHAVMRFEMPQLVRLGIFVVATLVVLDAYGRPSVATLIFAAMFFVMGYVQQLGIRRDAGDLEQFMSEE